MEVDSWLTGRRGMALPFTDACAPLCRFRTEFEALFKTRWIGPGAGLEYH